MSNSVCGYDGPNPEPFASYLGLWIHRLKDPSRSYCMEIHKAQSSLFNLCIKNLEVILGSMMHLFCVSQSMNDINCFSISNLVDGTYTKTKDVKYSFYHIVCVSATSPRVHPYFLVVG